MTAAAATDWLDLLGNLPKFAIEHACRQYLKNQPTRRPTPGAIRNMALSEMERQRKNSVPRRIAPPMPDPEPTPEQKARVEDIVRKAGFTAQRAAALKAAPMARSDEELKTTAMRVPHWSEGLPADHPKMQALHAARLKAGTVEK